jgi:hypothetical protein
VGNVTFFYPANTMYFRRTYCAGFALPVGCIASNLAAHALLTLYLPINQDLILGLNPHFEAATSKSYSLYDVFDLPNCFSRIGGVLSPGTIAIEFGTYPPDRVYRIRLGVGLAVDPSQNVDLPQKANYWRANP